ncbi:MAG: glutamine synthetase type III, partial [Solirubrobacterales bacterium]|nr:glutamine synthetase type III [Solirubrobacterales bacterium]
SHQELLRASVANVGQDHRLGANEAPPAIISIFLGADLERAFASLESPSADEGPGSHLGLGTPVLPQLPLHGGDRNRTSPFAFTGNKFEFRALGSSMPLSWPNTVLNTIAAEAIDELSDELESALQGGAPLADAVSQVARRAYADNERILFMGDNYGEEWHQEAERRGLENLRTTPDALPWIVAPQTVDVFARYGVLSQRELESRYEVSVEQYTTNINIEGETAAVIARTMLLPAAVRHLVTVQQSGVEALIGEVTPLVEEFHGAITRLEAANAGHLEDADPLDHARYMRDTVIAAMTDVRAIADRLEAVVADDLWPLPRYAEMLFIK